MLLRRLFFTVSPRRCLFTPPNPFASSSDPRRKEYEERRLVGYTAEEMYDVVANVKEYPQFVPWCRDASIKVITPNLFTADLQIGFPPILETYSSRITTNKPNIVRSVCTDGRLFKLLDTTWEFHDVSAAVARRTNKRSCQLHFALIFEFKSIFHSHLAHIFFDQVVSTMVVAFLHRAEVKYGKPSLNHFNNVNIIKKVS
ncbi:unnamed protein product [Anisakis simplex]|uniref:Polyketide_cyc domain-containing protein n=1 Tax=Anisakis simplex TaxID=6269 RepID=A0A0M3J3H6_ANISI|nr:unnamed protein product [Anisakis simplex]